MEVVLEFTVPFLPPSSNLIYEPRFLFIHGKKRFAGMRLSADAKKFQRRFSSEVVPTQLPKLIGLDPTKLQTIYMVFHMPGILNKTFGKKGGAKTRYKRVDLSNRLKLIEDCLRDAMNIDDSMTFDISLSKRTDPPDRVDLLVIQEDDE